MVKLVYLLQIVAVRRFALETQNYKFISKPNFLFTFLTLYNIQEVCLQSEVLMC